MSSARCDLGRALGEGGGLRGLLRLHLRLPIRGAVAPRRRAFDRAADAVAGGLERVELLRAAEDGDGHATVPVVPQIVLVEVDAVVLGLEL